MRQLDLSLIWSNLSQQGAWWDALDKGGDQHQTHQGHRSQTPDTEMHNRTLLSELELAGAQDGCVCWALRIFILLAASDTKRLHNLSGGVSLDRHFLIMLQLCTFVLFSRVAIHATAGLGLWRCSDSSNSIFRFKLGLSLIPNKYDLISRRVSLFIFLFHPVHT